MLLAFDFAGVLVLFKVQQLVVRREIKRQIKRGLRDDELHVITVSSENQHELTWKEENEFEYHGRMYEVVRKQTSHHSVTYYCINDTQEEALFAGLDELVRRKTDHQNPASGIFKKITELLANTNLEHNPILIASTFYSYGFHSQNQQRHPSPCLCIVVPPPQTTAG